MTELYEDRDEILCGQCGREVIGRSAQAVIEKGKCIDCLKDSGEDYAEGEILE